jgi:hypothetical protein
VLLANTHLLKPVASAEKIPLEIMSAGDDEERAISLATLGRIATKPAFDDLKRLCSQALSAKDEAVKRALSSLSKRIASRIKTPEALELVSSLD